MMHRQEFHLFPHNLFSHSFLYSQHFFTSHIHCTWLLVLPSFRHPGPLTMWANAHSMHTSPAWTTGPKSCCLKKHNITMSQSKLCIFQCGWLFHTYLSREAFLSPTCIKLPPSCCILIGCLREKRGKVESRHLESCCVKLLARSFAEIWCVKARI